MSQLSVLRAANSCLLCPLCPADELGRGHLASLLLRSQFGQRLASRPWAKHLWANRPWGEMSSAGQNIHGAKSPDTITYMSHIKLWLT